MRYTMKTYRKMLKEIRNYVPTTPLEGEDQKLILDYIKTYGKKAYNRKSLAAHMTASAIVVNQTHDKVLFAYHLIYQSYGWLGGHADGEFDLESIAKREIMEESGISEVNLLYPNIASLEVICVGHHIKQGTIISDHLHLNVSYLFEADEKLPISIKEDENSSIAWIPITQIDKVVTEERMIEIYQKILKRI